LVAWPQRKEIKEGERGRGGDGENISRGDDERRWTMMESGHPVRGTRAVKRGEEDNQ
jgi:hypothetical protein